MSVHVPLPDDLVAQIDDVSRDRTAFVEDEVTRLNAVADELNREAEDVLEYQVIP